MCCCSSAIYGSLTKTLKEYEATLEKQSSYIRSVEEEKESVQNLNEELLQKVDVMERQLLKASSSQDSLTLKTHELSEALEGITPNYIELFSPIT